MLSFPELLDYRACLESEKVLRVEVVLKGEKNFQETQEEISRKIQEKIQCGYGCRMQILLTRMPDRQANCFNSMDKRTFLRTAEGFSERV